MSRKKLIKLLGKEIRYTATINSLGTSGFNICLVDVKYKDKLVTDHAWIHISRSIARMSKGDNVSFIGTAKTYIDNSGKRNHGLSKCHDFTIINEEYEQHVAKDGENMKNRNGKY